MKKALMYGLLTLMLVFTLVACSSTDNDDISVDESTSNQQTDSTDVDSALTSVGDDLVAEGDDVDVGSMY